MDKLVYTAATGLQARMAAQAAIANNMANASTTGFRADRVIFDRMQLSDGTTKLSARAPTAGDVVDADRTAGAVQTTGRNLDVAVNGTDTWLTVQAPGGGEAYSKRGDLEVAPSGVLQTGDGFVVQGQSGPITLPPYSSLSIGGDGTISIIPQGGDGKPSVIDKLKLVSSKGTDTVKGVDNLIKVRGGGVLPDDQEATVTAGALEGSNVNMTQALVDMIENQRAYEVEAKMMNDAKTMDESGASLMRLPQ